MDKTQDIESQYNQDLLERCKIDLDNVPLEELFRLNKHNLIDLLRYYYETLEREKKYKS